MPYTDVPIVIMEMSFPALLVGALGACLVIMTVFLVIVTRKERTRKNVVAIAAMSVAACIALLVAVPLQLSHAAEYEAAAQQRTEVLAAFNERYGLSITEGQLFSWGMLAYSNTGDADEPFLSDEVVVRSVEGHPLAVRLSREDGIVTLVVPDNAGSTGGFVELAPSPQE